MAFPIILIVTVVQWLLIFLISFSSVVFNLLAGLFLLVAVLSLMFGIANWSEAVRTALVGFIIFMIPVIGQGAITVIAAFREGLSIFIRS